MPGQSGPFGRERMRIKIGESSPVGRGRWKPIFVNACAWPRERYEHGNGSRGGLVTGGSNAMLERKDRVEVAAYMQANPRCSARDIAMCCHMGNEQAERLKKIVEGHEERYK